MIKKRGFRLIVRIISIEGENPAFKDKKIRDTFFSPPETEDGKKVLMYKTITKNKISMASVKEKIAYALGDAAAGGIVWKVMSIAFPLFFTNVFGLTFAVGCSYV